MFSVKPGMRPITVGPRRIPATISAITSGSLRYPKRNPRPREREMMIRAWRMSNAILELITGSPATKPCR